MEKHTLATIIFFVLGIIEVHSFPSRNDLADAAILETFSEHRVHKHLPLQATPIAHAYGERIKREEKHYPKSPNLDTRIAALGEAARGTDMREALIRQIETAQQATVPQISAVINSYMSQGGDRNAAIQRFRDEHPTVANRYIPRSARARP